MKLTGNMSAHHDLLEHLPGDEDLLVLLVRLVVLPDVHAASDDGFTSLSLQRREDRPEVVPRRVWIVFSQVGHEPLQAWVHLGDRFKDPAQRQLRKLGNDKLS